MPDPETIRDIRIEALRYLYGRPSAAMRTAAILRAVNRAGVECTAADLEAQLEIMMKLTHLKIVEDPDMTAIKAWQIEAAGIRHHESRHV